MTNQKKTNLSKVSSKKDTSLSIEVQTVWSQIIKLTNKDSNERILLDSQRFKFVRAYAIQTKLPFNETLNTIELTYQNNFYTFLLV